LSFQDVAHLLHVLQRLVDGGNTVLVIEHHLDVIKTADHLIDLGPLGGDRGGELVATGTPEEIALHPTSYTGQYLRPILEAAGTLREGANGRTGEGASGESEPVNRRTGEPANGRKRPPSRDREGALPPRDDTANGTSESENGRRPAGVTAHRGRESAEPAITSASDGASELSTQHAARSTVAAAPGTPNPESAAARAGAAIADRIARESAPPVARPETKASQKRARQAANPRKETSSERSLREKREES
jgi:excinuclease ABC subunit A